MLVLAPLFPGVRRTIPAAFGAVFIGLALLGATDRTGWPPRDLFFSLELIPFVIGAGLIAGSLLDYSLEWRIAPGEVVVLRRSVFRHDQVTLSKAVIASAIVRTHEWDSRPNSYDVEIRTTTGKRLTTPERTTHEDAAQDLAAINENLPG